MKDGYEGMSHRAGAAATPYKAVFNIILQLKNKEIRVAQASF